MDRVTIELDSGAVIALVNPETELDTGIEPPAHNALGPLLLAVASAPIAIAGRPGAGYRITCRREQAEALRDFCEAAGEILVTFPEEDQRADGALLMQAKADIEKALTAAPSKTLVCPACFEDILDDQPRMTLDDGTERHAVCPMKKPFVPGAGQFGRTEAKKASDIAKRTRREQLRGPQQ